MSETKRLAPEQLARFRADYHECRTTVMPLVEECEALLAERDAALRTVELAARHGGKVMAERDRLAAALRGLLDACRHDRDSLGPRVLGATDAADAALAAEGGG